MGPKGDQCFWRPFPASHSPPLCAHICQTALGSQLPEECSSLWSVDTTWKDTQNRKFLNCQGNANWECILPSSFSLWQNSYKMKKHPSIFKLFQSIFHNLQQFIFLLRRRMLKSFWITICATHFRPKKVEGRLKCSALNLVKTNNKLSTQQLHYQWPWMSSGPKRLRIISFFQKKLILMKIGQRSMQ